MTDIYVVVADNDQAHNISGVEYYDKDGPLVFEQYIKTASLDNAKARINSLNGRYGKCRIAKLEFVEE
jgi:hypothetical protein